MGVLYNDTSTRRTFYISRIIDEEMEKGDLFVITGMSGAELAIRVLDIPDDDIIIPPYYDASGQGDNRQGRRR